MTQQFCHNFDFLYLGYDLKELFFPIVSEMGLHILTSFIQAYVRSYSNRILFLFYFYASKKKSPFCSKSLLINQPTNVNYVHIFPTISQARHRFLRSNHSKLIYITYCRPKANQANLMINILSLIIHTIVNNIVPTFTYM